jgi:two-component system sensor histidine kinase DesK
MTSGRAADRAATEAAGAAPTVAGAAPTVAPEGPEGAAATPSAAAAAFGPGRGRFRPFFVAVVAIFLAAPLSALLTTGPTPLQAALAIAAIVLIVGMIVPSLVLQRFAWGRDGWLPVAGVLVIATIATVLTSTAAHGGWLSLFYFAAILASRLAPERRALGLLGVIGVLAAVSLAAAQQDIASAALQGLSVSLIGGTVFAIATLQRANAQLLAAREEIGRLAVARERVRIARDLHDTLGHDLSVIALKSELAGRLLPADPTRASAEIADVERVARGALRSVRETVSGYRQPTLDAELAEVRASLAAAGIDVQVRRDPAPLPAPVESVLAWAVREGSTNILRHSGTTRASIDIRRAGDDATADILDDGPARPHHDADDRIPGVSSGLAGLTERVAAGGGDLQAGPTSTGGYRLHVRLPLEARSA